MALGNNNYRNGNQGNNRNEMWEPSYYSRIRIKNPEQGLALSFNFWKGTLKIIISEIGSAQEGRNNDLAYIHLSPTKARIMADAVKRIIDTEKDCIYGVDTGAGETHGFIAMGREANIPFLFIAKVNPNGGYESSQRFNFTTNYNYMLDVHDITKLKCQKEYMNQVELYQFYDLLCDYARAASGALGASFYDIGRYEAAKTSNLMRKIAEKVGVQIGGNGSNGRSNNSFFNNMDRQYDEPSKAGSNQNTNNSRYDNIDDLENALG